MHVILVLHVRRWNGQLQRVLKGHQLNEKTLGIRWRSGGRLEECEGRHIKSILIPGKQSDFGKLYTILAKRPGPYGIKCPLVLLNMNFSKAGGRREECRGYRDEKPP